MSLLGVSGPLSLSVSLTVLSGCSMVAFRQSRTGTYLGLAIGDGQAQTCVILDEQGKAQLLGAAVLRNSIRRVNQ